VIDEVRRFTECWNSFDRLVRIVAANELPIDRDLNLDLMWVQTNDAAFEALTGYPHMVSNFELRIWKVMACHRAFYSSSMRFID
jgi:hypothetical protein